MSNNEIADKIVEDLFTNGMDQKAVRLVLELENGDNGGGWGKEVVRDRILDILESDDVLNAKTAF